MKALIFHGTHGSPQGNWFQWLQEHLMMQGWQVAVPTLPTPDNQSLKNWITALQKQITALDNLDLVVGHSLGATFALKLIEADIIAPKQLILVSTLINKINNAEYDSLNQSFIAEDFNWQKILKIKANITILHGDNDPYVPLDQPETVAEKLQTDLTLIKNGGHLNTESGYNQFPEILEFIDD